MPSLEKYRKDLPYSYAPGIFPCMEAVINKPESVSRLLVSSRAGDSDGIRKLRELCLRQNIRCEEADKVLSHLSGKDNCYAAVVFEKKYQQPVDGNSHVVLFNPSDSGNIGTIFRTALGFGMRDIAIIRPSADFYDPHTVRASMGAVFSLNVWEYDSFEEYRMQFPGNELYPFMLDGSILLDMAANGAHAPFTLIFGNEGAGLPHEFSAYGKPVRINHSKSIDSLNLSIAAAIGIYAFERRAETCRKI
jgi:RNA methyltransferase, TrmH family